LLADKSGVLWVSLARGDVPELKDTLFMCVAAKKAFVDSHPDAVKGIQATLAKATKLMQDPATAGQSRATVRKNYFDAMNEQLFDLSYAAAVPGYLPSRITAAGYQSLINIQASVTGKNYDSIKFNDTVLDGAQAK
jgi:ABC-type nitrate/sulfonate/bicarbonate transport system substrate-binding protein